MTVDYIPYIVAGFFSAIGSFFAGLIMDYVFKEKLIKEIKKLKNKNNIKISIFVLIGIFNLIPIVSAQDTSVGTGFAVPQPTIICGDKFSFEMFDGESFRCVSILPTIFTVTIIILILVISFIVYRKRKNNYRIFGSWFNN